MPPENDYHRGQHDKLIEVVGRFTEALEWLKSDSKKNWEEHGNINTQIQSLKINAAKVIAKWSAIGAGIPVAAAVLYVLFR